MDDERYFCPSDENGLPQFRHDFANRETWRPQSGQGNRFGFAEPPRRLDVVAITTTTTTMPPTSKPRTAKTIGSSSGPIPNDPKHDSPPLSWASQTFEQTSGLRIAGRHEWENLIAAGLRLFLVSFRRSIRGG